MQIVPFISPTPGYSLEEHNQHNNQLIKYVESDGVKIEEEEKCSENDCLLYKNGNKKKAFSTLTSIDAIVFSLKLLVFSDF